MKISNRSSIAEKGSIISRRLFLLVSTKIVIIAGIFGANYGFSPADTFIIWILMAILINQSVTWKKWNERADWYKIKKKDEDYKTFW